MNGPSTSNAPVSEATSNGRPKPFPKDEKELLKRKADNAKTAFVRKARETSNKIFAKLSPGALVRRHPLGATGLAVAGGFFVGFHESPQGISSEETEVKETHASAPSVWSLLLAAGFEVVKNAFLPVLAEKLGEKFRG